MIKELVLEEQNIQIFNYSFIFKNFIEKEFINSFFEYKLNEFKKEGMSRKLFIHHNIHSICDFILKSKKKGRQILFFDYNILEESEICNYIEESKLKAYLGYTYHKIRLLLPIRVFQSSFTLDYYETIHRKKTGLALETTAKLNSIIENTGFEKFTFEKCKRFIKKEGLVFLDKAYFNNLKSKQLLIN